MLSLNMKNQPYCSQARIKSYQKNQPYCSQAEIKSYQKNQPAFSGIVAKTVGGTGGFLISLPATKTGQALACIGTGIALVGGPAGAALGTVTAIMWSMASNFSDSCSSIAAAARVEPTMFGLIKGGANWFDDISNKSPDVGKFVQKGLKNLLLKNKALFELNQ